MKVGTTPLTVHAPESAPIISRITMAFVTSPTFGLRWEKPIAITADGCVNLAPSQIGVNGPIEVEN